MNKKILELRRQRAAMIEKARHLVDLVDERDGVMTEQETKDYDQFMGEIENLGNEIRRREELQALGSPNGGQQQSEQRDANRPTPDPYLGMSRGDVRRYSLIRAIRAAANRDWRGAELEREASEAMAKRYQIDPQGFYVPYDWLASRNEQRDLNVGTPTAGGNLVATDLLMASFIELLRNRSVVQAAGATILTGLVGDIAIPRQTGGATAYWIGEGNAPTESQQAIDQVPMSPKTVGAFTDYTRKLMLQTSLDVEMFVRGDLAAVLALAIDYASIHGNNGTNPNQPDGIENITGVGAPGQGLGWAGVVGLETEVSTDNADVGRMAYVTNPLVRGKLKTTEKASSTAVFVWGDSEMPLNGYRALVSNQVRANAGVGANESFLFFGNWADLIIAMWSGLDILVDPYTGSTAGTMRIVALQDVDIAVRHAESFAFQQGVTN